MSKNRLMIIMMTLLTASALGGVVITYAQEVDENMAAAENLLSLLGDSESEVTSLFESIVNDGGDVPEDAQEALQEAQELRLEAQDLFDEGSYLECVEKATEALNKYGKALDKATEDELVEVEGQVELVDEETEKMVGLFTAIEKSRKRIEKLEEIADDLDALEVDTSDARGLLADAEEILDNLIIMLESGDFEESEIILGGANSLIGQATGMLKSKGEPKKQEKIEHFIDQTIHRVGQLEKKMNKIFNKRGIINAGEITDGFSLIIVGLEDLDTHDDLKDVIDQLKTLVKDTKKIGKNHEEGLEDETIEAINTQTKMEARIERYRNKIQKLEGSDELVEELLGLLGEAEDLLAQAEEAMGSEDEALAEEFTDAAEEILDAFDDMFDEAKDEHKDKSGDKFDEKLEEINERIVELESHIQGVEDEEERVSYEGRLDEIRTKVDEAITDENLDEIKDLLEVLEDEFDIKDSPSNDKAPKNGKEHSEEDPEDLEPDST
ncbi:hypothetical protein ACFL0D_02645 [Thermoproteota archaeon]